MCSFHVGVHVNVGGSAAVAPIAATVPNSNCGALYPLGAVVRPSRMPFGAEPPLWMFGRRADRGLARAAKPSSPPNPPPDTEVGEARPWPAVDSKIAVGAAALRLLVHLEDRVGRPLRGVLEVAADGPVPGRALQDVQERLRGPAGVVRATGRDRDRRARLLVGPHRVPPDVLLDASPRPQDEQANPLHLT